MAEPSDVTDVYSAEQTKIQVWKIEEHLKGTICLFQWVDSHAVHRGTLG